MFGLTPRHSLHVTAATLLSLCLAQVALGAEKEDAKALFEQGRALLADGNLGQACSLFDRSLKLESSAGTALNLADCHAREGKTAQAYQEFQQALTLARREGWTELADEAERRSKELKTTFPKLQIVLKQPVAGLVVMRDNTPLAEGDLGSQLALPPGRYTLSAQAPEHESWSQEVVLQQGVSVVTIPALRSTRLASTPMPPASPEDTTAASATTASSQADHTLSWVLFGSGGALGVGALVTGILKLQETTKLDKACPNRNLCSTDNQATADSERNLALATDVLWVGGALTAAAGLTLWVLSEGDSPNTELAITPSVGPNGAGIFAQGSF